MADIRLIRRRIKGVKSISKITRAMEMIATSKMKRAQERGLAGRPYSEKIRQVIADLSNISQAERAVHPLLQRRPIKKIAIVHITPDRGLCGGLVANINRRTGSFILEQPASASLICVGRKGVDFMRRTRREIRAEFTGLGDRPSFLDSLPISRCIIDDYTNGEIDAAYLAYPQFVSTLVQNPVVLPLLPIEPEETTSGQNTDFLYEPDSVTVFEGLLPRFIEMQIYHAILEAIASEQSARMVAMKNATENAAELVSDLTLMYNKARQEAITKELLDITGGVEALSPK
ncbi:MAG: ATP synthase F1 subunit gamma [Dehalococcoidales bacterium]